MSLSTWQAVENPVQSRQDCLGGRGIGSPPPLTTAGGRTRHQFGLRFAWTEIINPSAQDPDVTLLAQLY